MSIRIIQRNGVVIIEFDGMSKIASMKNKMSFQRRNIVSINYHLDKSKAHLDRFKTMGTSMYQMHIGETVNLTDRTRDFCFVQGDHPVIMITLKHERYHKIYLTAERDVIEGLQQL